MRWRGSTTTPLPMTDSLPGRTMPEGSSDNLIGDAVDDQRMAGVMAALKAHHDIGPDRQPIDDLALALVAPLGADHHHIRHFSRLFHFTPDQPGTVRKTQMQKPRRKAGAIAAEP